MLGDYFHLSSLTVTVPWPGWPLAAYALVGRDDIAATLAAGSRMYAEGEVRVMQSPGARTPPPTPMAVTPAPGKQAAGDVKQTVGTPAQRGGAAGRPALTGTALSPAHTRSEGVATTAAEVYPPAYRQRLQIPCELSGRVWVVDVLHMIDTHNYVPNLCRKQS